MTMKSRETRGGNKKEQIIELRNYDTHVAPVTYHRGRRRNAPKRRKLHLRCRATINPPVKGVERENKDLKEGERIKKQTRDAAVAKVIAEGHGQET
jgi:hypothetical protein